MDWRKILEPDEPLSDEYATWDMDSHFHVMEHADGTLWLAIEATGDHELPVLRDGFLGLELHSGTSIEEAKQIARVFNNRVSAVSYTGKITPEFSDQPGRGGVRLPRNSPAG